MPRRSGKHRREQGARSLSRYDFLAATHGPAVAARLRESKDSHWQGGSDVELFRRFAEKVDPSGTDKDKPWRYLKWACTRYLESPVFPEDLYKIGEDLTLFEDKKKRGLLKDSKADIQHYSIKKLADFTTELRGGTLDGFDDMLAKAPVPVTKETTILYRGPEGIALAPHSREAAIHWSRGTRWCTGAENSNNMFFHYNISGPLVILFTAVAKERYQTHINSAIMDAQDNEAAMTPALSALLDRIDGRFLKKKDPSSWTGPPDWRNRDYVLTQVKQAGGALKYAAPGFRSDRELVLEAVRRHGISLEFAAPELQADPEIVLEAVKQHGGALEFAAPELRADPEIVLKAVRKSGVALQYAAPDLRADPEIVLKAVEQYGAALKHAAPELRENREFVLKAVRKSGVALQYAAPELKADHEIVFEAVRQVGLALQFAAPEFWTDRELVLNAVRWHGPMLGYAAPELRADPELVLEAVRDRPDALKYAAPELRADPKFVLEILEKAPWALQFAAPALKADSKFVLEVVRQSGQALRYAARELQKDRDIVLEAVRQDGNLLEHAAEALRSDPEIVLKAVRQNGWALRYAAPELRTNREIVLEAVKADGRILEYAAPELKADRDVVFDAVRQNGWALEYAAPELRADPEIVLEAVRQDAGTLFYAAEGLRNDAAFLREALQANPNVMTCITPGRWTEIDPALKREAFLDPRIAENWKRLAWAADCGVTPDLEMQRNAFACARTDDPETLANALHIFPALREEWKKRALSLEEAAILLNPAPAAAPKQTSRRNYFFHI